MDEKRAARTIVENLDYNAIFEYIPEMELVVPETDRGNSLSKIAFYFRDNDLTLSDLYIGYAVSLYKYTTVKVVHDTLRVLGNLWPKKNIPKNVSQDDLHYRMKKMCQMGMLRRYNFQRNGMNIVLFTTTPEFSKAIYVSLKLNTDARPEKDLIAPIEFMMKAAASLVSCELMKSIFLKKFDFLASYTSQELGKNMIYCEITTQRDGVDFSTIVEPFFTRCDLKRYTEEEWEKELVKRIKVVLGYMKERYSKKEGMAQTIFVIEDKADFKVLSTLVCNLFPEDILGQIYFTSEGALRSGNFDLKNSMIRIVNTREDPESRRKMLGNVTSQVLYDFF